MPVKRGIQLRRCTLCGKTGHNRAKCSLELPKQKVSKIANISEKNNLSVEKKLLSPENTKAGKLITVRVFHQHNESPYVVDLTHKKGADIWDKVPLFRENQVKSEYQYQKVDWAELVKKHNQDLKIQSTKSQIANGDGLVWEEIMKRLKNTKVKNKKIPSIFKHSGKGLRRLSTSAYGIASYVSISYIRKFFIDKLAAIRKKIIEESKQTVKIFTSRKLAYGLAIILLLVILPFPAVGYYHDVRDTSNKVVEASTNAFLALQSSTVAALQANIPQAQSDLNFALNSFGAATSLLEKDHKALVYVVSMLPIIGSEVQSRQHLLLAGHQLALGNTYLVKGVDETEKIKNRPLTNRFNILARHLQSAIPQYQEAMINLAAVDIKIIPSHYQQSFEDFKLLFTAFINDMKNLVDLSDSLELVFGNENLRRYLLVFQNNNELRPTGGFIGSFAVIDIQKGKILNLDMPGGGSYDLQGQLDQYVKPPLPLQLNNKRWEFQDGNWFSDFSASARKLEWFYEHGRNATVDGVIAINASVLQTLLSIIGPLESVEHNLTISAADALEKLQYKVEVDYDKEKNRPKEVLASLAGQFIGQMGNVDKVQVVKLLVALNESMRKKDIQVFFNDPNIQAKFKVFGWTGELEKINNFQDYLMVVDANLQGQKSDAKIEQVIEHQAEVQTDGSVIDTVVVRRQHKGEVGELFYGSNNVNYLRLYVPLGAELIDAGGFNYPPEEAFKVPEVNYQDDLDLQQQEKEISIHNKTGTRITEEFGKTAFGNWIMTAPGETSEVYFKYRLPFKLPLTPERRTTLANSVKGILNVAEKSASRYSIVVQKQSGITSNFISSMIYPDGWLVLWGLNDELQLVRNGATYQGELNSDLVLGVVAEKER